MTTPANIPPDRPGEIEAEVRVNVLAQKVGLATVADLALSDDLLSHIVDRVVRSSFEERYRTIVPDRGGVLDDSSSNPAGALTPPSPPSPPLGAGGAHAVVRVNCPAPAPNVYQQWPEGRPGCRAFRAQVAGPVPPCTALSPDAAAVDLAQRAAAEDVARRLATEGLIATLARVIERLGPRRFTAAGDAELAELATIGVPVDLLAHFRWKRTGAARLGREVDGAGPTPVRGESLGALDAEVRNGQDRDRVIALVQHVASSIAAVGRGSPDGGVPVADELEFVFRPTEPGFVPVDDAGTAEPTLIRAQMTRGGHWLGPGSGDNLDLLRHVAEALPHTPMLVGIESKFADEFAAHARGWKRGERGAVTVLAISATVSQWAQDNARGGEIRDEGDTGERSEGVGGGDAARRPAVLAPRYPSRGDDGSVFVPGEAAAVRSLACAGVTVVPSPLLFQGGNVLLSPDPRDPARRVLLVGEAEIARNCSLGLSPSQALDALCRELGAHEGVVLPAVSYHLDYEVSVRAVAPTQAGPRAVVAFVNDARAGATLVLACAIDALELARLIPKPRLKAARQHLAASRWVELLELFFSAVIPLGTSPQGQITESFAKHFARGPGDHGVGNLRCMLLALDTVASWTVTPWESAMHPHARAYLGSLRRRERARQRLAEILAERGFRVVGVPSLADGDRGVCAINGVHASGKYLMPASGSRAAEKKDGGGVFQPLDAKASNTFQGIIGGSCLVYPIPTAESQRRHGAVRCSISLF